MSFLQKFGAFKKLVVHSRSVIGTLSMKELLAKPLQIPEIQRPQDKERVQEIVKYQKHYHQRHSEYNFPGVIIISYLQTDNHFYLIDGQHRYSAIRELYKQKCNIQKKVAIELRTCSSKEQLEQEFTVINLALPVEKLPDCIDRDLYKQVWHYFQTKYPKFFSNSKHPQRTNINKQYFQEALGVLIKHLEPANAIELWERLEECNQLILKTQLPNIPKKGKKTTEELVDKCKQKGGLYFGLYPFGAGCVEDSHYFQWVELLLGIKPPSPIQSKSHRTSPDSGIQSSTQNKVVGTTTAKKKKSRSIPKVTKNLVWDHWIGKHEGVGYCFCCRKEEIRQTHFEGGHVLAHSKGGAADVANLRPICSLCNKSMGNTHMETFIKESIGELEYQAFRANEKSTLQNCTKLQKRIQKRQKQKQKSKTKKIVFQKHWKGV